MKKISPVLLATLAVLTAAGVAFASEGGGGHEAHGPSWTNLMFRIVNFALFVGLIYKLAGQKIKNFFGGRRYQIESELADLARRRTEAEAKLAEVEQGIANLASEREAILADYRAQGEALKDSIVARAEKMAEQVKSQAKISASQEAKLAMDEVRAEVADLVVDAAEKLLRKKLKKEDHEKLVDDYLTKVVLH